MRAISLLLRIEASPEAVWTHLADLPGHAQWMSDVLWIEFPTGQQRGPGTVMVVASRLGPFRARDLLRVTAWDEPSRMAVEHIGVVEGRGEFRLEGEEGSTLLIWNEKLKFPWFLGGRLIAVAVRPFLVRVFRRNLEAFRTQVLTHP